MFELVARDKNGTEKARFAMPQQPTILGREAPGSQYVVPGDLQISRKHAELHWQDGKLLVRKLKTGRNCIFYGSEERFEFQMLPGERFVIGKTTFDLEEHSSTVLSPTDPLSAQSPLAEMTCTPRELQQVGYANASELIGVLGDLLRAGTSLTDEELESRVVDVLRRGIPNAGSTMLVRLNAAAESGQSEVEVRARSGGSVPPSRRLCIEAIERRRQNRLFIWPPGKPRENDPDYTPTAGCDWAFCVPLPDDPLPGWGLYATGQLVATLRPDLSHQEMLKADLKFAELVANLVGALRQSVDLQRRQGVMSRFLPRPVLAALAASDMEEVLKPRETDVTVLFCDLRGSCRVAEEGQGDLQALWKRVEGALDIMASSIIAQNGVIGDFQGDAAMGFWGWPLPCANQVELAARAALAIRRRFAQAAGRSGDPLAGFACGIGLTRGLAIAGRLGTVDQFKVDVFGPTVNLAARLESMTKFFRVPILVDEACAADLKQAQPQGWGRLRRLSQVRPAGMSKELMVSELMPPLGEVGTIGEPQRRNYEAALEAFRTGQWADARELCLRYPKDGPSQFLLAFMDRHPQGPPAGFTGLIVLEGK